MLVPGSRAAVADAARAAGSVPGSYHVSHNDNPAFVPGNMSFAFELLEARDDLRPVGPWHVVIPTGGGALFCGAARGFRAWASGGRVATEALPRLYAAQAAAARPWPWPGSGARPPRSRSSAAPTVCGGIEIERPARGEEVLAALRASGGAAVACEDADVLRERDRLARLEGVYAEPTSAAAFAAPGGARPRRPDRGR